MHRNKTAEEMEILIDKLNRKEIKWEDIEGEVQKMRKISARTNLGNKNISKNK